MRRHLGRILATIALVGAASLISASPAAASTGINCRMFRAASLTYVMAECRNDLHPGTSQFRAWASCSDGWLYYGPWIWTTTYDQVSHAYCGSGIALKWGWQELVGGPCSGGAVSAGREAEVTPLC
jgi:hypothetical protein